MLSDVTGAFYTAHKPKVLLPLKNLAATKLFGTSHGIASVNDMQTMLTIDHSPKGIELRANKIK